MLSLHGSWHIPHAMLLLSIAALHTIAVPHSCLAMRGFPKRYEHQLKPIEGANEGTNAVGVVVPAHSAQWCLLFC